MGTMTEAQQIVAHYRAKGLSGSKLRAAIARHVRLLSSLDMSVALALYDAKLVAK
jgi:hypothetical protein